MSRQTVSNALHAPAQLAPDTLRRVLSAIDELGYRPNSGARALRARRPRDIACRIPDVQSTINAPLYGAYLHGLSAALRAAGFGMRLHAASWGEQEVSLCSDMYLRSEIAAVVLTDPQIRDERVTALHAAGVPVVQYGRPWAGSDVRWVDVDGAAGVAEAVRWCAQRGHRRIGYLGWDEPAGVSRDRERGWRDALDQLDLPSYGLNAHGLPDSVATGSRLTAALLATAQPPTAFICATDVLALGALTTVRERGLRPGVDVAVVGFDDTPTAALAGLSSIRQPIHDAAQATANLVLTQVADGPAMDAGVLIPAALVRRST